MLSSCLLLPLAHAQQSPRVGLVLGGGGARGAAHIGVLQVLAEQRVQVACVAGTSMGALVSGALASGVSPDEMAQAMARANWRDMFIDAPEAAQMSPRTRGVSRLFLPGAEFGVTSKGPVALPSLVSGQKIKLFFNQLIHGENGDPQIEALRLPVSLVATDLVTGSKVSFRQGSLSLAMRASMSVPGVMTPVDHAGTRLVDGGLVDNVPIDEVMQLCNPDVVIAVNVGSPLFKADEIDSLLSVAGQMVNILTEQNVTRSLTLLRASDVYIRPDLEGIGAGDFEKHSEAIARGRKAAEQAMAQIRPLASSPASYAHWWSSVQGVQTSIKVIDQVEVEPLRRVNAAVVAQDFERHVGKPVNPAHVDQDVMRTYGQGDFEAVDYALRTVREKNVLRVTPTEKAFGPDFLRGGFNLESIVGKGATYNIRVAYDKTWINSLGGELLMGGQIGNKPRAFVEWYQPVSYSRVWFVQSNLTYRRDPLSMYQDNRAQASFKVDEAKYDLMGGVNLGTVGQFQLGRTQRHSQISLDTGTASIAEQSVSYGGWSAKLDLDQFDRLFVPSRGWSLKGNYFSSSNQDYAKGDLDARIAQSWGTYVVHGRVFGAKPLQGDIPVYDAYSLGGFLNLSGFFPGQIVGQRVDYASVRLEKILSHLPTGIRGDMRLGVALERARVNDRFTETRLNGTLNSVALYLGGETPLGPVYLGWGHDRRGNSNVYLFLGTP